jgi:prevent-host-death family protein
MAEVTIRELRNQAEDVVARVSRGELIVVTRDGSPVAELHPLPRPGVPASTLLERWRNLPRVGDGKLRHAIDEVVEPSL